MRVLVEQTRDNTIEWLRKLGLLAESPDDGMPTNGWATEHGDKGKRIAVTVLMGGEDKNQWDLYPERDAIIIGTQDMLLSRALNRGYGMSRYRWPMHFALLNNDCLWVMDEVQLMGNGLTTTAQMEAFRESFGTNGTCKSVWLSATMRSEWLKTVDFDPQLDVTNSLTLGLDDRREQRVKERIQARKTLKMAAGNASEPKKLATEILDAHRPGTRTLVVVNTVRRAAKLHRELKKRKPEARLILIHSRFRPQDRKTVVDALLSKPGSTGTIIVSTQVVEAGVDVTSTTLFTELAPWPSLVQRFGRCNRYGTNEEAVVFWIDLPNSDNKGLEAPYGNEELNEARKQLIDLENSDVGPAALPDVRMRFTQGPILRRKDIVELFDTTPDLAGHDIDVSRFIREPSDTDVRVFWRDVPEKDPDDEEPDPKRDELCPVGIGDIRSLVRKKGNAWSRDALEGTWERVWNHTPIHPGLTLMLRAADGKYTESEGWDPSSKVHVPVVRCDKDGLAHDYDKDSAAVGDWMTVAEHTDLMVGQIARIMDDIRLDGNTRLQLLEAARWHDAGKAHPAFQAKIKPEMLEEFPNPPAAKAPRDAWRRGRLPRESGPDDVRRKYFRHELVSGLLALLHGRSDLVAYLSAAHHGKVRLSIRSMPGELKPDEKGRRFARGIWDGDAVPGVDLGDAVKVPPTSLDLSYMELGDGPRGPSWLARMLSLRDSPELGPFRLAFLEALMKVADERASGDGR